MSRTWGSFSESDFILVRMAAAMQGSAEFFAPGDANGADERIAAANNEFIHISAS